MTRTTVSLDSGLFRKLKQQAAAQGRTFQDCLNEYLRLGIEVSLRAGGKKEVWRLPELSLGRPLIDVADREAVARLDRRT